MHLKTCFFLVAIITLSFVSCRESTQFELVPSSTTGISFNNVVTESDSINPLDMEYLYNGGGVAIGDFNADDRPDIYFTSSQTPNKLYLNKGDFEFQDVTDEAGVGGMGRWCNGASVVDINNDGLDDIYVCASIKRDPNQRTNLLYINKGKNPKGIPVFKEMSREYNLADTSFSVHAAFF